jgi:hypothetical protein
MDRNAQLAQDAKALLTLTTDPHYRTNCVLDRRDGHAQAGATTAGAAQAHSE